LEQKSFLKEEKAMIKRMVLLGLVICILSGCSTSVKHVSHESLMAIKDTPKNKNCILVADLGDKRDDDEDKAGSGVSYWLPVGYNLEDENGKKLHVSQFIADSITMDLQHIGYDAKMLNNVRNRPLTVEEALSKSKTTQCQYLVTSTVKDAKSNYWGFLVIPFFEPVWTRLEVDAQLYDLKNSIPPKSINMSNSDTEWYFGKLLALDAVFDAGLFGRHWVSSAWGETVIPEGVAKGVIEIHKVVN
jgi:hypothetical protein